MKPPRQLEQAGYPQSQQVGHPQSQTVSSPAPDASPRPQATPAPRHGIGFYFWSTIFALIVLTAALVVLALLRPVPEHTASDLTPPPQISITQEQLEQIEIHARLAGYQAVEANLDGALDAMFEPVHASIPAYVDFHYSVWGQYAELLTAAAETTGLVEDVGSLMRQHLFDGFEDRHTEQMGHLEQVYKQAVTDRLAQEGKRLADDAGQPLPEAAQLALRDAQQRMIVTAPAVVTGSAAATVTVVAIIKPIAKKVVTATATKAAAKGIGKMGGIGGTTLAGASLGSFLGPVGTVVGGVGGAVVGWLVVDYAVVSLDEYFNRDDFEAELRKAIVEQKSVMRQQILNSYAASAG